MNRMGQALKVETLISSNDIVITAESPDGVHVLPYRGKTERRAILSFLEHAGKNARAIVYSHETKTGPIGIDIRSQEQYRWTAA